MLRAMAQPVIKWVGGKGKLLPQLLPHFPTEGDLYVEPFVGGASVLLSVMSRFERCVVGDINPHLINLYGMLQSSPEAVIAEAKTYPVTEQDYYRIRKWSPTDNVERAARFLYLNKTCFNGLYRENMKGEHNVAWGKVGKWVVDEDNILAFSRQIQRVAFHCLPFTDLLDLATTMWTPSSFVYCDPPYIPASPTANFTSYSKEGFGQSQHILLNSWMGEANNQSVTMAVSNSLTETTLALYSGWDYRTVQARRNVNRDGAKRGPVPEILLLNHRSNPVLAAA